MIRRPSRASVDTRRAHSLMERIRADDLQEPIEDVDPFSARVASIKASLVRVLNARAGGSGSSPGYGLSDLNDASVNSLDMLRAISHDIKQAIELGEPRVTDVTVDFERFENTGVELSFRIFAKTQVQNKNQQVAIDVLLTGGRRFKLK